MKSILVTAALLIGLAPAALAAEEAQTPVLSWQDCQDGFQCSTAKVPLDYDQPYGTKIDLALIRLPATDPAKKIGSLFVNFGGPGASGVERLRGRGKWEWLFSPELRAAGVEHPPIFAVAAAQAVFEHERLVTCACGSYSRLRRGAIVGMDRIEPARVERRRTLLPGEIVPLARQERDLAIGLRHPQHGRRGIR